MTFDFGHIQMKNFSSHSKMQTKWQMQEEEESFLKLFYAAGSY